MALRFEWRLGIEIWDLDWCLGIGIGIGMRIEIGFWDWGLDIGN